MGFAIPGWKDVPMALAIGSPPRITGGNQAEGAGPVVMAPVMLPVPSDPEWSSTIGDPPSRWLRWPRSALFAGSKRDGGHLVSCLWVAILSDLGRAP